MTDIIVKDRINEIIEEIDQVITDNNIETGTNGETKEDSEPKVPQQVKPLEDVPVESNEVDPEPGENPDANKSNDGELATNVTLEPQDEKQADLRVLPNPVAVSKISVPVDDDTGQLIGEEEGFKQIETFIETYQSKSDTDLNDANILKTGTELAAVFTSKIDFHFTVSLGIRNKYRILLGSALNITKAALKQHDKSASWEIYFKEQIGMGKWSLSSAEKYMKLAKIQHVRRWAFLGLERLESIRTVLDKEGYLKFLEKEDRNGDDYDPNYDAYEEFFKDHNISISFEEENIDAFRVAIDAAVLKRKIVLYYKKRNENVPDNKKVENTVKDDLIDDLISDGIEMKSKIIGDLYRYDKDGTDPNSLLEDMQLSNSNKISKENNDRLTDIRTIDGIPVLVSELRSKVKYFNNHKDLIVKIKPQHIRDLETELNALKALVASHQSTK